MTNGESNIRGPLRWAPLAAALFAFVGICDSVYLTVHHYTAEPVPCTITGGCEMVLTSRFAEIGGIPLAAFGVAAYVFAFILAVISLFGNRRTWQLFGVQATLMALFSGWLIYVQAAMIHAFCQFCLLSAATSFTLCLIFIVSIFVRIARRAAPAA
jgi:uncharacterized membrane protein